MADDKDRHLKERSGRFYYQRRVPIRVAGLDPRAPLICESLKTADKAVARIRRDAREQADELYWSDLLLGNGDALNKLALAKKTAEALGIRYRTMQEIVEASPIEDIAARMKVFREADKTERAADAAFGGVTLPDTPLSEAFEKIYVADIVAGELADMSEAQKKSWKKVKLRAVNNFIKAASDKPILEITRDDALALKKLWQGKVDDEGRDPNSANRDIGNMRKMVDQWVKHFDVHDHRNPFINITFESGQKVSRQPMPLDKLKALLKVGAFRSLKADARRILFVVIETGARPSEIANLRPSQIFLDHEVPHIWIRPLNEGGERRKIKTQSSIRKMPLVGAALEAMKASPSGFAAYRDRENSLSAMLNKALRENDLVEGETMYTIRHAFYDRLQVATEDDELRRMLMGHRIDRPRYGELEQLTPRRLSRSRRLRRAALPLSAKPSSSLALSPRSRSRGPARATLPRRQSRSPATARTRRLRLPSAARSTRSPPNCPALSTS